MPAVALAATLLIFPAPAQETAASPESTTDPLDIVQVDFRLLRVVSETDYGADPDAYDRFEAMTLGAGEISLPVDTVPLLRVTELDHAVVRQDRLGLWNLDLFFLEADAEAHQAILADHIGQRVLWVSGDNILADQMILGRENPDRLSLFYGEASRDRIVNVLEVLQVAHTFEVAEDLIVPETRTDELHLEAMRTLRLRPNPEGFEAAFELLAQCLQEGGEDHENRAPILFAMAELALRLGNPQMAAMCCEDIRQNEPDFPQMIAVLKTLRDLALNMGATDLAIDRNHDIVALPAARGPEAINAQTNTVQILDSAPGREEEMEREVRRLINLYQDHIAGLPLAARFDAELMVMAYQIRVGETEESSRSAEVMLSHLPDDAIESTLQVFLICNLLESADRDAEAREILQRHADQFAEAHDLEDETNGQVWEQIEAALAETEPAPEN